jgi:hypothetical protein
MIICHSEPKAKNLSESSFTDEAELEQREKVFLNLSRKQMAQIKNVIRQVWQHKDAVKSIVEWVGKLTGAFAKGFAGGGTT